MTCAAAGCASPTTSKDIRSRGDAERRQPAHRGPGHAGRPADEHVVVGPVAVTARPRRAAAPARRRRPARRTRPGTTASHEFMRRQLLQRRHVVEVADRRTPKSSVTRRLVFHLVIPSTIALIGARPVPPATHRMSRRDCWSTRISPAGAPSRRTSPTCARHTSGPLTQPAPTARTWNSSRPSGLTARSPSSRSARTVAGRASRCWRTGRARSRRPGPGARRSPRCPRPAARARRSRPSTTRAPARPPRARRSASRRPPARRPCSRRPRARAPRRPARGSAGRRPAHGRRRRSARGVRRSAVVAAELVAASGAARRGPPAPRATPCSARKNRSRWTSIAAGNSAADRGGLSEQRRVEVADHDVRPVAEQAPGSRRSGRSRRRPAAGAWRRSVS